MKRRKGIAVLLPALALVAATVELTPPGAAATTSVAGAPSPTPTGTDDPNQGDGGLEGGGQDGGQNGGLDPGQTTTPPADGGQATADPTETAPPEDPNAGQDGQEEGQEQGQDQGQGQQSQVVPGPKAEDFANIRQAPRIQRPRNQRGASRGTFTTRCGRNQNGHRNPDNFIVAPGVQNGAHHLHDYVGNLSTDGFSNNESLAAAGTTCARGDKSVFFWPVVRDRTQDDNLDSAQQSEADGNTGRVETPTGVTLRFQGSPTGRVTAMPQFLRIITGDAKAGTNGPGNARALWSCSGFTDRGFPDKYPICPGRSQVTRILEFPSCWDGQNTDSANHRTHVVFPDRQSGQCPEGTQSIPQLRMTLTFSVPNRAEAFAVDSFPEQAHNPVTDHGDFENLMPDRLMRQAVGCINGGRRC